MAIYVGDTAIYAYCNEENKEEILNVLDIINYVEVSPEREEPKWLLPVARLLQFLLYIPMAFVGRIWLWHAALAVFGLFIPWLSHLLNTLGIIVPCIIIGTTLVGAILNKALTGKKKK